MAEVGPNFPHGPQIDPTADLRELLLDLHLKVDALLTVLPFKYAALARKAILDARAGRTASPTHRAARAKS